MHRRPSVKKNNSKNKEQSNDMKCHMIFRKLAMKKENKKELSKTHKKHTLKNKNT